VFILKAFSNCCAESRNDGKMEEREKLSLMIQKSRAVLIEFRDFESKLDMHNSDIKLVRAQTKDLRDANESPKKEL
jgi:hypothetical protein